MNPNRKGGLQKMLENEKIDTGFKEILLNLLTINPYFRWTAAECLEHPMFDDVRVIESEGQVAKKIKLQFDMDDAFNYEEGISEKYQTADLIENLLIEVDKI